MTNLLVSAAALGMFLLSSLFTLDPLASFDLWVQQQFVLLQEPHITAFFVQVTKLADTGSIVIAGAAIVLVLLYQKRTQRALFSVAAIVSMLYLYPFLKLFFARERPVPSLVGFDLPDSFPSGHAAMIATFVSVLLAIFWENLKTAPARLLALLSAVMVISALCFSRVYLQYHWFSDVLGGSMLGIFWVSLLFAAMRLHGKE